MSNDIVGRRQLALADQILRKWPSVNLEISLKELSTNSVSLVFFHRLFRPWTRRGAGSCAACVDHLSWLGLCLLLRLLLLLWLLLAMHQTIDVGIDVRVIKDNLTAVSVPFLFNHVQIWFTRSEGGKVGLVDRGRILLDHLYFSKIW